MQIVDPYDFVNQHVQGGNVCFLGHGDLRNDYIDQISYRIAYLMLSRKFKKIVTEGNVKRFRVGGTVGVINIDKEYLHSIISLEDIPEGDSYDYFKKLVADRLKNVLDTDVDCFISVGGGVFHDSYDSIALHRLAEMQFYLDKNVPVGVFPISAYFSNKKLLTIFTNVIRQCKFVMVRDAFTYKWLLSIGVDNVVLSWDLPLLETPHKPLQEYSGRIGVILTIDRISSKGFENLLEKNNKKMMFFSTSPRKDERRLRYAASECGGEHVYASSPDHLMDLISSCSAIVSDKYGGIILSVLHGIPVIPLCGKDHSSRGFLEMLSEFNFLSPLEIRK